ncbi:uncharacterized protein BDW43DRAFT_66797 [Aspergillus alliaceus]|uniref:uncharacterized protein n=1 Tax=Petromyces alliaceus TaxID=209559 RepID=UPI0012A6C754|nr:uncharacterized protein BDW43DRAFT_66797 [Aspergillus alliaceus]KAB8234028.1 hypothetical protein BDW43DRAFT_66797 [Aspergillus alliaceus]
MLYSKLDSLLLASSTLPISTARRIPAKLWMSDPWMSLLHHGSRLIAPGRKSMSLTTAGPQALPLFAHAALEQGHQPPVEVGPALVPTIGSPYLASLSSMKTV